MFWAYARTGYLKALERGNSVPRPKGFCEADKVKLFAVFWQIQNVASYVQLILSCFMKIKALLVFLASYEVLFERPGLPVRGPAFL